MMQTNNLVRGQWYGGRSRFSVVNPFTGESIATVPKLDWNEIQEALSKAKAYQSTLTPYQRYEILMRAAEGLKTRKKEFSELISMEAGICIQSSRHEVDRSFQAILFSAEEAKRLTGSSYDTAITPDKPQKWGLTIWEPVGLVLAITPFNHPLNQVVHKIGPALAANNSVVLKPSEKTPLTALAFVELLVQAGLPPQMLSVITCDIQEVSEPLLSSNLVDMVTFTGSTAIGETIHQRMGVKKCLLELGGNGAFIVLEDANLDQAVQVAVKGAFSNSGQRCTSIKRLLVQQSIADEFAKRFHREVEQLRYGDPMDEENDIGTVIDEQAAIKLERVVRLAVKDGATLRSGGKREGALFAPTFLDHVHPESEIVVQETFGPIAPMIRFEDIEEAIALTNSTPFGLQSGVMTENIHHALAISKRLRVGAVIINEGPGFRVEQFPFGGVKKSGIGREGIQFAVKEMSNQKLIIL